jgi:hypothetical protein
VKILSVGASGNLGSHLTRHLMAGPHFLRLLADPTIAEGLKIV